MRISDWSSDVCSSDLRVAGKRRKISFCDERHGKSFAGTVKTSGPNVKIDKMMIRWIEGKRVITATKRLNAFAGRRCSAPGFRPQEFIGYTSWNFASFRSEEHTSELQYLMRISYAVFCLK